MENLFLNLNITLPEEETRCLSNGRNWTIFLPLTVCPSMEKFVSLLGGQIARKVGSRKIIVIISSDSWYYEYGPIEIYIRCLEGPPYEFNLILEEITEKEARDSLKKLDKKSVQDTER